MRRCINSSAPVSAWQNTCLYRIGEATFYSEWMSYTQSLRRLKGEKNGERRLSEKNLRFEEPVLTISTISDKVYISDASTPESEFRLNELNFVKYNQYK